MGERDAAKDSLGVDPASRARALGPLHAGRPRCGLGELSAVWVGAHERSALHMLGGWDARG